MDVQHTIAKSVSLSGRGLFGGQEVNVTFEPAPPDHGIVFVRTDLGGIQVPALVDHVVKQERRTTLRSGDAEVQTCEHCLSALAALNIDNMVIQLDADELPGGDGSAQPFLDTLNQVGTIAAEDAPRNRFKITEPIVVREGDKTLAAVPCDDQALHVVYDLEYPPNSGIDRQMFVYDFGADDYAWQVAPARTFLLESEALALQQAGIGTHLTEQDLLIIGSSGPIGGNTYRLDNEPVRHKVLDLIGDLYLLGAPVQGRIIAYKSGHSLNHALVRKLIGQYRGRQRRQLAQSRDTIDIRSLMRIMPHRYPMLLVDRVLEIDQEKRIVGIKNVTINEPFFQGHYPTAPYMPGVLIVEAMAQLSAVLIGQKLEHTGKLGFLMSLDRVKLRRPVIPGDQLIMEAETVRVRSRIAHMKCRAFVGPKLVAEAEVKFMLVDNGQE